MRILLILIKTFCTVNDIANFDAKKNYVQLSVGLEADIQAST